jgi:ketosteroid isomerase-like protein
LSALSSVRSRDLREHLQVLVDAGEPGAHRVHGGVGRTDRAPALGDRDEPVQLACPVQPWLQAIVAGSRPASVAACATTRAAVSNSASGPIVRESLAANTNDGPVRVADDTYLFEDRRVSVTDQLQKLLDHQSITSLPHVYCDAVIRKDYESLANLFTEDGEFVVPAAAFLGEDEASKGGEDRRYKGREALLAMYEDSIGGGIIPLPSVSDIVYEVNGDVAVGRCVSTIRYANNKAAHFLAFYDDAYARTAEGWKFTRRVVRMMSFDLTEEGA